jgi:hypothetical protein
VRGGPEPFLIGADRRSYAAPVKIVVGVTDNRWASFLRGHSNLTEANF